MPLTKNNKTINAWCWYDWANSSYSLVITSAIFPSYFLSLDIHSASSSAWWQKIDNSVLYAYMLMGMSSVFATKTLNLTTAHLIGVILALQLLAIAGSYLFVVIAKKFNNLQAVKTAVLLWIVICFIGYSVHNIYQFYIMAIMVGLVMGGTQALSRSAFAGLIQGEKDEYATYFSLYDVLDKIGVVIGTSGSRQVYVSGY